MGDGGVLKPTGSTVDYEPGHLSIPGIAECGWVKLAGLYSSSTGPVVFIRRTLVQHEHGYHYQLSYQVPSKHQQTVVTDHEQSPRAEPPRVL